MHTEIVRYIPDGKDHRLTGRLIECYREVFADRPWNEFLKCLTCEKYWGTKDLAELTANGFQHCGVPVVDFWPWQQVLTDIVHEITPEASCWLCISSTRGGLAAGNYRVLGFCWGYPINGAELEEKLGIKFLEKLGSEDPGPLAYQDEIGVITSHQGQGIARDLVCHRLNDFLARELKFSIVRTRELPEPSVTFLWYTEKLGYQVLARYPGDDGRVILGRPLAGLKELLEKVTLAV